jgi:hypothetical protein
LAIINGVVQGVGVAITAAGAIWTGKQIHKKSASESDDESASPSEKSEQPASDSEPGD